MLAPATNTLVPLTVPPAQPSGSRPGSYGDRSPRPVPAASDPAMLDPTPRIVGLAPNGLGSTVGDACRHRGSGNRRPGPRPPSAPRGDRVRGDRAEPAAARGGRRDQPLAACG